MKISKKLNKNLLIIATAPVLLVGSVFAYKNMQTKPKFTPVSTPTSVPQGNQEPTPEPIVYEVKDNTVVSSNYTINGKEAYFTLKVPSGWKVATNVSVGYSYNLALEKGEYRLRVNKPDAYSSSLCDFDDIKMEYQGVVYENYTEVQTDFGLVRVAGYPEEDGPSEDGNYYNWVKFDGCQQDSIEGYWDTTTELGLITLNVPADYDTDIIDEMIGILRAIEIHHTK